MEIITKLNLNAHPKNVDNNSLVDGVNLMLSDDGVIQTEKGGKYNTTIYNAIFAKYNKYFKILYCIECNVELVIFVQRTDIQADLSIFRYNEKEDKCIFVVDNFQYNGGNLIGVFTYNKNNLIIAISEYFDNDTELSIPLRTLNLGEFDKTINILDNNALYNNKLHSIKPELKLPNVNHTIKNGNAYKGWHHIFIRYKISNNTYTQWYYTNHNLFLDDYKSQSILKYDIDATKISNIESGFMTTQFSQSISDNSDFCSFTYDIELNNIDNNFIGYQIGIIIITKDYTKCLYSDDIETRLNITNIDNFIEYSASDVLSNTFNYYNAKTLEVYNNRLYIGNYKETTSNIDINNINVDLALIKKEIYNKIVVDGETDPYSYAKYIKPDNYNSIDDKDIFAIKNSINIYEKEYDYINGAIRLNTTNKKITYIQPDDTIVYLFFTLYKWDETNHTHFPNQYYVVKTSAKFCAFINYPYQYTYEKFALVSPGRIERPWERYLNGSISNNSAEYTINPYDGVINCYVATQSEVTGDNGLSGLFDENINWDLTEIWTGNTDLIIDEQYAIDINKDNWDWTNTEKPNNDVIVYTDNTSVKILNSFGIDLNEYYSFYIHFINKYGEVTKGFPLGDFNINYLSSIDEAELSTGETIDETIKINNYYNSKNNNIICFTDNSVNITRNTINDFNENLYFVNKTYANVLQNYKYYLKCKINNLPKDYVGYFVSCEKIENRIQYIGFGKKTSNDIFNFEFYSDRFNIDDKINFDFNRIKLIKANSSYTTDEYTNNTNNIQLISLDEYTDYIDIEEKRLYVADDIVNNKVHSTKLFLKLTETIDNEDIYFCILYNNDFKNKYINTSKNLVICSNIVYNINDYANINTKNSAISQISYLYYQPDVIYDSGRFVFIKSAVGESISVKPILNPYHSIRFTFVEPIPFQSINFNNEPKKIVYPAVIRDNSSGDTVDVYSYGVLVELKNTIDLFKQRQLNYDNANIVQLDYYNDNIIHIDKYPKTIRRSYPILDESYEISWRKFAPDVYKNIQENKGNIIKVCNSGNILLVHTEYSLFMFDGNDSIKSVNDKIQLASIDIWDVNYKELFSSKLGFGGISKEHHSIIGDFGYIWFDSEHYNFYRLDGQMNMMKIDEDIINFIKQFKPTDVIFGNDIINNRVLIMLINDNTKIALSYNTKSNTFISRHTYKYKDSYSTKNRIYLLDGSNQYLVNFVQDNNTVYEIINEDNNQMYSHIDIICKDNYENIKFLDAIQYKISKHSNVIDVIANDYLPVEGINGIKYAGDYIRIYSEYCDTDNLKILFDTIEEFNNPDVYVKPYWYLGNWYFNAIRNKLKSYIEDDTPIADEHSRVYGNYFVIRLIFNTTDCIKIESLSNSYKYK